jgi:Putative lumazine-binding
MKTIVLLSGCLLSLSLAAPTTEPAAGDREAVLGVVRQLFDGMRARDAAKVRTLFHSSAQLFSSSLRDGQPAISVMSVDEFATAIGRPGPDINDERTRNEIVHVDGTFASVWAEYAFYRGTTLHHCGIDAFHLARDGEGWKIVSVGDTRRTQPCDGWTR